jgi:hypothetical protein
MRPLERHRQIAVEDTVRAALLAVSPATIDRLLSEIRIAAAQGRRRRAGFSSAVRRSVPVRTFADWGDPPPGFVEVDFVAHSGTSAAGAFVQTMVLTDIATGWTECVPVVMRAGALALQALQIAQELLPFPLKGVDFDNDGAFMNEPLVDWRRARSLEVTRSRAYRKNDQAWVEQKNGAIVRRLVGYGRFEGPASAAALARLYAAARLHVNLFQPSFKLREKTRVGAKVTKRWHAPATPADRALASGRLDAASALRIADLRTRADPVVALAAIRAADQRGTGSVGADALIVIGVAAALKDAARRGEQRPIPSSALQAREADPEAPVDAGPAPRRNRRLARCRAGNCRRRGADEADDTLPGSLHGKAPPDHAADGEGMARRPGEAGHPQRDRSPGSSDRNRRARACPVAHRDLPRAGAREVPVGYKTGSLTHCPR